MHQRGMGTLGVIIAMVIAGLIIYGIIYYGPEIWERIRGSSGMIQEISEHPERYVGKEVTVEGYVWVLQIPIVENEGIRYSYTGSIFQKDPLREAPPNYFLMLEFSDNLGAGVVNWAKYRLTGIVQKEVTLAGTMVKLIVSRVEPT